MKQATDALPSPRRTPPAAFTLIEVMVALAIVAVALTALLGLRNRSLAMAAFAHHLTEATLLANARNADLSTRSETGTADGEAPPYRWIEEIRPTPLEGVREAVVTVLWQEGAHEEQVEITTYLFDTP